METGKPQSPLIEFATEYFKVHARSQAKLRKRNNETREEKLIPKPSSSQPKVDKKSVKISGPIFSKEDNDSESDDEFQTKLDLPDDDEQEQLENQPSPKKKRKLAKGKDESKKVLKKKKKLNFKVKHSADDAQDELVDFELSD